MKFKIICASVLVAASLLGFFRCTTPLAGNGSQTPNARVEATLYNPGGTPAKHTTVRFYQASKQPYPSTVAVSDSTVTDSNGNYVAMLDSGVYTVLAKSDSGATFRDSVKAIAHDTIYPPKDTLRPTGSLAGKIQLEPGDDARKVFILFMGTNTFATPEDSAGNFTTLQMAKGKYRVRIISTLDNYAVMDTNLTVAAGKDSTMASPIKLRFTGIPIPEVTLTYDTLKQIVTLAWNKEDTGTVKGFYVYRRNSGLNGVLARINTTVLTDTVYKDSTGVQDSTYEYRVASVDKSMTEGVKSAGVGVKVVGAFVLLKTIKIGGNDPFCFAISKDSLIYVAFRTDNIIKVYNQKGDSINSFGQGQFNQPYGIAIDSKGSIFIADPNGKIVKFAKDGTKQTEWQIDSPSDITIDQNDNIFVLYSNSFRIARIDSSGNKQDTLVLPNQTGSLVLDNHGNLYLVDPNTSTVNIFSNSLKATSAITGIPSNMLKVTDNSNNLFFEKFRLIGQSEVDDIIITDKTGQLISTWGYFNTLMGIRIVDKQIYILDYNETPWQPQIRIFSKLF